MRILQLFPALLIFSAALFGAVQMPSEAEGPAACDGKSKNILFSSSDGGNTWNDLSAGLPADPEVSVIGTDGEKLYLGTGKKGLYYSNEPAKGKWTHEDVEGIYTHIAGDEGNKMITGIYNGKEA